MPTKQVAERKSRANAEQGNGTRVARHSISREELIEVVAADIQKFIRTDMKAVDERWLKRQEGLYKAAMRKAAPEAQVAAHPRDLIARATKVPRPITPTARLDDLTDAFCLTRRHAPYRNMVGVPSAFEQVPCSPALDDAIVRGVFPTDGSFHLSAKVGSFFGVTCAECVRDTSSTL